MSDADYTAAHIVILSSEAAQQRFGFAQAAALAAQYPAVAPEFIARLVEACALAGFPLDRAIRRYLDRDRTVAVTPELLECHRELMRKRHLPA